jgi:hypothetical protein
VRKQIEAYQDAVREVGPQSKAARNQREGLDEVSSELLRGVCYFIAAGILRCCPLESARNRELSRLGFVPSPRPWPLLPGQVALLLLAVTAVLVVREPLRGAADFDGADLVRSLRIASLHITATLTAVYLWHRLRRPETGLLRDRPYHQYLFAAGLAVGICLFLSLLFQLAQTSGALTMTLERLRDRFPHRLLSAAVAFGICFLLDNPRSATL